MPKVKPEKIQWAREVKQIWQGKLALNLGGKKSKSELDKKDKTYMGEKAMEVSNSFGSCQNQVRFVVLARSDISGVVLLRLYSAMAGAKESVSDHGLVPVRIHRVPAINFNG